MSDSPRPAADAAPVPHPGRQSGVDDYLLAMGHELRAPLNAVIGTSGLLLEGELSDHQRQHVRSIHAAGESLATILNDLMDLSRLLRTGLPIDPIPFDLRSMVEETAKALSPRAEERSLALRVDWRPDIPRHVVGDPGRTRQVLGNLVGHALNATSQGEVAIRVSADGDAEGAPLIRFTIEDTGIGIPADRLDRVFDEYVPVDASPYRSFGISGLGLRISAELVRLMKGEIGAESEVGTGSRFWFRLPMPLAKVAPELTFDRAGATSSGRILVVEADLASRRRLSDQLAEVGWSVAFADELGDVYGRLREAQASDAPFAVCMLSDYAVRPAHTEVATRIKANPDLAPTALVILTAVGSPGDGKKLWHAGFAAYLRRPVPTEELHDALLALSRVGDEGRGPSLITRHSLAEIRNATPAHFEGIDEMLASLTAPDSLRVLLIGATPAQQIDVTETLALAGLAVEMAGTTAEALDRLTRDGYTIVVVAREPEGWDGETYARLREQPGAGGGLRIVAFADRPDRMEALHAAGVDEVLPEPVRQSDLDRVVRHWIDHPVRSDPDSDTRSERPAAPSEPAAPPPAADAAEAVIETETPAVEPPFALEAPEALASDLGSAPEAGDVPTLEAADVPTLEAADVPTLEAGDGPALEATSADPADPFDPDEPIFDWEPELELEGLVAPDPSEFEVEPAPGFQPAELDLDESPPTIEGFVAEAPGFDLGGDDAVIEPVDLATPGAELERDEATTPAGPEPTPDQEEILPEPLGLLAPAPAPVELDPPAAEAPEDQAPPPVHDPPQAQPRAGSAEPAAPSPEVDPPAVPPDSEPMATAPEDEMVDAAGEPELAPPADDLDADDSPAAVEAPAAAGPPVVDETILQQLASGSGIFAQQVVGSFLRDAPQRITELRAAALRRDPTPMTQALQGLKAMAGLLSATRLVDVCAAMQSAMDEGDLDAAAGMLPGINRSFLEAQAVLERAVPPGAAPSELEPVSAAFLEQLGPQQDPGTRALAKRVAATFRIEAPLRLSELKAALFVQDAAATQRVAQALKGMCSLIGADPTAKLCALVEADARLRRVGRARRYIDQLALELDRVYQALAPTT